MTHQPKCPQLGCSSKLCRHHPCSCPSEPQVEEKESDKASVRRKSRQSGCSAQTTRECICDETESDKRKKQCHGDDPDNCSDSNCMFSDKRLSVPDSSQIKEILAEFEKKFPIDYSPYWSFSKQKPMVNWLTSTLETLSQGEYARGCDDTHKERREAMKKELENGHTVGRTKRNMEILDILHKYAMRTEDIRTLNLIEEIQLEIINTVWSTH